MDWVTDEVKKGFLKKIDQDVVIMAEEDVKTLLVLYRVASGEVYFWSDSLTVWGNPDQWAVIQFV